LLLPPPIPAWLARSSSSSSNDATANDVVYIEIQAGDLFLESETDLSSCRAIFEYLRALALPPEASVSLITRIAHDLSA
jgi:hypothetical protein